MPNERFVNLAKMTAIKERDGQKTSNIKVGMEAKGHAFYNGFCNQRNIQNPFGSVEDSEKMTCIMMTHCLKGRRDIELPKARSKMQSSMQRGK